MSPSALLSSIEQTESKQTTTGLMEILVPLPCPISPVCSALAVSSSGKVVQNRYGQIRMLVILPRTCTCSQNTVHLEEEFQTENDVLQRRYPLPLILLRLS